MMMLKEEKISSNRPDTKCIWSKDEDRLLVESMALFENHRQQGIFKWSDVAKQFTVAKRSGKQCKERWINHLDPNLKKHAWTHEEDLQLLEAQRRVGNSWTKIALEMDGRGENDIKNRWYSAALRKKRKPEDTRTMNDYYAAATSLKMLCKDGYSSASNNSSTYESYLSSSNYYSGYGLISQQENNPLHNNNDNNNNDNDDGVGKSLLKSINVSEVSPFVYHHQQQQLQQQQQQQLQQQQQQLQQQQQQQLQQQQKHHNIQTMSIQPPEFNTINPPPTSLFVPLTLQKSEENTISTSENTSDSDPFIYNHNNFFRIRSANNSNNNSNNNSGYTSPSSTLYNALLSACQSPSWLGESSSFQDDKT